MMRGRIPSSPTADDPAPKRARLDLDEDGRERVKLAIQEQVQGLVKLVDERRAEVRSAEEEARKAEAKLVEACKKLTEAEAQLTRAQSRLLPRSSAESSSVSPVKVKSEQDVEPRVKQEGTNEKAQSSKPPLVIPGSNGYSNQNLKSGPNIRVAGDQTRTIGSRPLSAVTTRSDEESSDVQLTKQSPAAKMKGVKVEPSISAEKRIVRKRPEPRQHTDLVPHIRRSSSSLQFRIMQANYVSSQHKRKLRSLAVNPTTEQLCATSALDGIVNLWQIQGKGIGLSLLSSIDCLSPGQRRWPEDMAWDPTGDCLFACYSADGNDNQVAIIGSSGKKKAQFLEDKPHVKGILNSIVFMPWYENTSFATGGSDHAVIMWEEKEDLKWKYKALHRNQHSSAVMGVAGLHHKQSVLSVGADKRVIGFDTRSQRPEFKYVLESKAMGVLPNPADFNLFMVQTGTPGQQLHLFDYRVQRSELHVFGWTQESSESQSALINQTWSPDGRCIASGSADPKIHIFDIRYNSKEPSQSIKAHQKRVFKAAWHPSLPLLVSISSDLNIGLHRYAA